MGMQVHLTGILVESKTATFMDENKVPVEYGKVQVLIEDASGDFFKLQNIKVKKDKFPLLAVLFKHRFKEVTVDLSMNEFKGNTHYYLENVLTKSAGAS